MPQIHITNGTRVQTLAMVEGADGGMTLLSSIANDSVEIHIPAAARAWMARLFANDNDNRAIVEAA